MKKEKMFTTDFYTIRFDLLKNRMCDCGFGE